MIIRRGTINIFFLGILCLILSLSSCKSRETSSCPCDDPTNPECPNYNPCFGKELPSARFKMSEGFLHDGKFLSWEDDVFIGFKVDLSSDLNSVEFKHTWYIGSEIFYTQNPPSRRYDAVPRPATITISHVIQYTPDTVCFPNDDGYDSIAQSFYLIKRWDELGTYGTFRGVIDNQTDSFDLGMFKCEMISGEIVDEFSNDWTKRFPMIVNFHNLGDTVSEAYPFLNQFNPYGKSSRVNSGGIFLDNTDGKIEVLKDGSLYMEYRVRDNAHNKMPDTLWHTFTGRKLP